MCHVLGYTVAHDVSARDWQLKRLLVPNTLFRTEKHFVFSMKMKTKGLIYAEMAANGWLERPWTHFAQLVLLSPPGALVKSIRT